MATPDPSTCSITGVTLEENHILCTAGKDTNGNQGQSSLDLDTIIGNINDALSWGGTYFSSEAQNIALLADGKSLDADLKDGNGDLAHSSLELGHEIVVQDGQLALRTEIGIPHTTAHSQASSVADADQQVLAQVQTVGDSPPVGKITTVSVPDSYALDNASSSLLRRMRLCLGFGVRG